MPLIDFADTIESVSDTYPYKPGTAGTVVSGVHTRGARTPTTILACVQPLQGEDLQRMPEALRVDEVLQAFTVQRLNGLNEVSGADADHLEVNGIDYEVQSSEPWGHLGGYYRSLLKRVDR